MLPACLELLLPCSGRRRCPDEHGHRVLRKRVQPLAVPLGLLYTNPLAPLLIRNLDMLPRHRENLDPLPIRNLQALNLRPEPLLPVHIHHGQHHSAVTPPRGTDIQPRRLDAARAAQPLGLRLAQVLPAAEVHGEGVAAHVLAEEEEGPPGRLLHEAVGRGHERGDDVDGLGDVGHADVGRLADEDVEPDADGQGIGERIPE
jgi:hypothetical protein